MDRLTEKLQRAGGVVQRQMNNIESRADAVIAREAVIEAKTNEAFKPHEALLDEQMAGLDALERQLALVTNGPLPSSGGSPEGQQTPSPPVVGQGNPNFHEV